MEEKTCTCPGTDPRCAACIREDTGCTAEDAAEVAEIIKDLPAISAGTVLSALLGKQPFGARMVELWGEEDDRVETSPLDILRAENARLKAELQAANSRQSDLEEELERAELLHTVKLKEVQAHLQEVTGHREYQATRADGFAGELKAVHNALRNGADEAVWPPGSTVAEAVARLVRLHDILHLESQ
jgi:hypothetical protein